MKNENEKWVFITKEKWRDWNAKSYWIDKNRKNVVSIRKENSKEIPKQRIVKNWAKDEARFEKKMMNQFLMLSLMLSLMKFFFSDDVVDVINCNDILVHA